MIFSGQSITFASQLNSCGSRYKDQPIELKDPKLKDFAASWVDSSVFLFYLEVFCIVAFLFGGLLRVVRTSLQGANRMLKFPEIPCTPPVQIEGVKKDFSGEFYIIFATPIERMHVGGRVE